MLILTTLGCLISESCAAGGDYWVYFGTYSGGKSQGIYVSRMDAAGKLNEPEVAAATTNPAFLAVDPKHRFLYAANEVDVFQGRKNGGVSAFALDAETGHLMALNDQPSIGTGPCHVQVDATGRVLLVANYGGGSVAAYPLKEDGSVGVATSFIQHEGSSVNPERQAGPHGHCIITDPANRFALVCDLGLDKVLIYKLDAARAKLTPNKPPFAITRAGAGPRHLAFDPSGHHVYVIDELDCTMTVFRYDAARGALSDMQNISTLPAGITNQPGFSTAEVVVHPSGKFLYGSNRGHNSISVFSIDKKTGKLALIDNVPSGGKTPRCFNIDPTGRFLLAANQGSDKVIAFSINADTGRLTPTGQVLKVGNPVCVIFVPVK